MIVLLLLTFLQGGMLPPRLVGWSCIVASFGMVPAIMMFQLVMIAHREAALEAMGAVRRRWFRRKRLPPSSAVHPTEKASAAGLASRISWLGAPSFVVSDGPLRPASTPSFAATFATA